MTLPELTEIANQRMSDPNVLGRFACNLRSSEIVAQRHHDNHNLGITWQDAQDFWRCTIFSDADPAHRLAQIDIHENSTIRADLFTPGRITVSPEEGILCFTRYRAQ